MNAPRKRSRAGIMRGPRPVDRALVTRLPQARRPSASYLAAGYVAVCFVLSLLAFVGQDPSFVFFYALVIAMLPISLSAWMITYIGGLFIFGPGDWPTWARVAEALFWTALAAVWATALLRICRARSVQAQPD